MRGPRVDPVGGNEQLRRDGEVRRREAKRAAARVARDDRAVDLGRAAEQRRRSADVALAQEAPDLGRGDTLARGHAPHLEAEAGQQVEIAAALPAETEVLPGHDRRRPQRPDVALDELLRLQLRQLQREVDDDDLLDTGLADQLQPPLQRRDQLDLVAEHDARVRVEGDDGVRLLEHAPVAEVDAVEGADGERLGHIHNLASASSTGITRCSSASSTEKGPTSVRRRETQWPPRASAIARTYVPEETSRSSSATPPAYPSSSSSRTCDLRTGISTSTPRRCSRYARSPPIFTAETAGTRS